MEEKNETGEPRRYMWPRYLLAGLVFWIMLAVIWVAIMARHTREQRDTMQWTAPMSPAPVRTLSSTNSIPLKTNAGAGQSGRPAGAN